MPTSATYKLSDTAYLKIYLHIAKHPQTNRRINGVLLGRSTSSGVLIEDAVALLHNWTSLSPMMEIGLDIARSYATEIDLDVVGYYQTADPITETSLAPVGEKVASQIQGRFKDAIALGVSMEVSDENPKPTLSFMPHLPSGHSPGQWRLVTPSPVVYVSPDISFRVISLSEPEHLDLIEMFHDFDDHLVNVSVNWLKNDTCMSAIKKRVDIL